MIGKDADLGHRISYFSFCSDSESNLFARGWLKRFHKTANNIKNNLELCVVSFLKLDQFSSQLLMTGY